MGLSSKCRQHRFLRIGRELRCSAVEAEREDWGAGMKGFPGLVCFHGPAIRNHTMLLARPSVFDVPEFVVYDT